MPNSDVIRSVIPHQGGMCLLERVLDWDESRIRLTTATHRSLENPLRNGGRLRSVHLCEYGAQAMAVHGGLVARGSSAPRLLVSLRGVHLHVDDIDGLLTENRIFKQRNCDIGVVNEQEINDWAFSGVMVRGSGLAWDLRRAQPYECYNEFDFKIPIGKNGDCYDRYLCRMAEMVESVSIML